MNKIITVAGIDLHQSANGLYLITDLWKASGKRRAKLPHEWLDLKSTKELINELQQQKPVVEQNQQVIEVVNGGDFRGTYLCEDLCYAYAMWINAKFALLVIRSFREFVNAETLEELKDLKFKLDNAVQQDFFRPEQQPRDKGCLHVILKCSTFQAEVYHDELIKLNELEVESDEMVSVRKRTLRPSFNSKAVIGKTKSGALVYDPEALKKILHIPTQTDWT